MISEQNYFSSFFSNIFLWSFSIQLKNLLTWNFFYFFLHLLHLVNKYVDYTIRPIIVSKIIRTQSSMYGYFFICRKVWLFEPFNCELQLFKRGIERIYLVTVYFDTVKIYSPTNNKYLKYRYVFGKTRDESIII